MKNKFLLLSSLSLLSIGGFSNLNAQQHKGNVGINLNTPKAALDIKSTTDDRNNVLRFSTKPSTVNTNNEYAFFVGERVGEGHNLRIISLADLIKISEDCYPYSIKIVANNKNAISIPVSTPTDIPMNNLMYNLGASDYEVTNNGEIKILEEGIYDVNAWAGVKAPSTGTAGDLRVSILKKSTDDADFKDIKLDIIPKTNTSNNYDSESVGGTISFAYQFKAGDLIKIRMEYNAHTIEVSPEGTSISITRIDHQKCKGQLNHKCPQD